MKPINIDPSLNDDFSKKKIPDLHKEMMFALGVPSELIPEEATETLVRILSLPEGEIKKP